MMQKNPYPITVLAFIIVLGILFQFSHMNELPLYTHAWAQSDRYAISLGFTQNHLNFFKPQTFILNPQFPGDFKIATNTSITAVDFPIHDFIAAIFMKLSGNNSVWIFRTYDLIYSFAGLFFLFKLALLITGSNFKSLFIVLLAATSPVFVYYQNSFLPSIPSLSNCIIGFYFYIKYLKEPIRKNFRWAILFITLATLSRSTFAIHLLIIASFELIKALRKRKLNEIIPPLSLSFIFIVGFYLYNNYLRSHYGSIFLNHLLPAESWIRAKEIIKHIYHYQLLQYFSKYHYLLFALIIVISGFTFFKKGAKQAENPNLAWMLFFMIGGYLLFFILMMEQFPAHDYYFLDSFFFPTLLLLCMHVKHIPGNFLKYNPVKYTALLLLSIPLVMNALQTQKSKRESGYWDRTMATMNNFKDARQLLDSLKISNDAKILVIDAYAPNLPFILMNRKGYAVMVTSKENIQSALKWKYDYIVIQNEFFISDIYINYPEIISQVEKIADNGKISVCVKSKTNNTKDLIQFLGYEKPLFEVSQNYDDDMNKNWENLQPVDSTSYSGKHCGHLTKDMTYGITYRTKDLNALTQKNTLLVFTSYFKKDSLNDCEIVVSLSENNQNTYYKTFNIKDKLRKKNTWEKLELSFNLPQLKSKDYEFVIFIHNTGKNDLCVDDFCFRLY